MAVNFWFSLEHVLRTGLLTFNSLTVVMPRSLRELFFQILSAPYSNKVCSRFISEIRNWHLSAFNFM